MDRYPHKIIIQNSVGDSDNPYSDSTFETVFEGRCRCFLDKRSSGTDGEITENSYQVVIPSPNMVDIGENFKVGVKLQHNSGKKWDLVGFVKDFARYDRVCNLYFQITKDNQISEDIPDE